MTLTIAWSIGLSDTTGGVQVPTDLVADVQAHDGIDIEIGSDRGRRTIIQPEITTEVISLESLGFRGVSDETEVTGLYYRAIGSPRQDIVFGGRSATLQVPVSDMSLQSLAPAVTGGVDVPVETPAITLDQVSYTDPEFFPDTQPSPRVTFRSLILLQTIEGGTGPAVGPDTQCRWTYDNPATTTPTVHPCDVVPFETDDDGGDPEAQPTDQVQFRRRMTNSGDEYDGVDPFDPEARTDFSIEFAESPTLDSLRISVRNADIDTWSPWVRLPTQPIIQDSIEAPRVVGTLPNVTYTQNSGSQVVATAHVFEGVNMDFIINQAAIDAGFVCHPTTGAVTIPTNNLLTDFRTAVRARNSAGSATTAFLTTVSSAAVPVAAVGTISDRVFNQGAGTQTLDVSGAFAGTPPITYSITNAPAGVSISGAVVSVSTANLLSPTSITVKATNAANPSGATQTFRVSVIQPQPTGVPLWRQIPDFNDNFLDAPATHPSMSDGALIVGGDLQLHVSMSRPREDKPYLYRIGGDMNGIWEFDTRIGQGKGFRVNAPGRGNQAYGIYSIMSDPANSDWYYFLGSTVFDTTADTTVASGIYQTRDGGLTFTNIQQVDQVVADARYVAELITCWPLTEGSPTTRTVKVLCPIQRFGGPDQDHRLFEIRNGGASTVSKGTLAVATYGRARALVQHPTAQNTVFICSKTGLWRTTNWDAATPTWSRPAWTFNGPTVQVGHIWIDPTDVDRMIVSAGKTAGERGIWYTVNGGTNWTRAYSANDVVAFDVGRTLADSSGRWCIFHIGIDSVTTMPIRAKFLADDSGFTAFTESVRTLPAGVAAGNETLDVLSGSTTPRFGFSKSGVMAHPVNPLEFVIYGVRRMWRSTDGGASFHLINGLGLGFNAREMTFSSDEDEWDKIAFAVADMSLGISRRGARVIDKKRLATAPSFKSGFSVSLLPAGAPVAASRQGAAVVAIGDFTGCLAAFKDDVWETIRNTTTEQYGVIDYCPSTPNWMAAGAWRSNNNFTGHIVALGNSCHAVGWSKVTDGLLWGLSSNGQVIMYSTDFGANFQTYVNTGVNQNLTTPTVWLDPHTDARMYSTTLVNGRAQFCLFKGAPGSAPTKVNMAVEGLPLSPVQWAPRTLVVDPFNPRIVYGCFRTFGVPFVYKFTWNSGFTEVQVEDITRNLPYGCHMLTLGVSPHTGEPILSTVYGLWVLPPPDGHRETYAIENSIYNTAVAVPTNRWEDLFGGESEAPVAVGSIPDVTYSQNSGTKTVATAANFDGKGLTLTYALITPPSGVTINTSTGVVSIPTTAILDAQLVRVRATSTAGTADQTFRVTVQSTATPPVWSTIPNAVYVKNTGDKTVDTSQYVSGSSPITFSLTASPSGTSINASTGVVTISTANVLSAARITVRAENSAGNASRGFDVTVQEEDTEPGGPLPAFPTGGLSAAVARPNNVYSSAANGMGQGAAAPWSAPASAYGAAAGQTTADNKVKSELRSWLSSKGPACQGNYAARRDFHAAAAITLAKLTPRIWNSFSAGEKAGLEATVEAIGVLGACMYSNTYSSGNNLVGGKANKTANPNISNAYPALVAMLRAFKGSDAATTSFLNGLNINDMRARLQAAGCSNAVATYSTSRKPGAPSLATIESACNNWKSFRDPSLGVPDLFGKILAYEIGRSCGKQAYSGYGGNAGNNWVGAGVPGSGSPQRGRMINNNNAATIAPVAGRTGMVAEMNSADGEGPRVSCAYSSYTIMTCTVWVMVGLVAGLIRKTADMNTAMNKLDVGWRTFKIHSDNGFYDWAHDGGVHSGTWTSAQMGTNSGWPYMFPSYFDVVFRMYEDLGGQAAALSAPAIDHPLTVIDTADLDEVKTRVDNDTQPQKAAYTSMISFADSALNLNVDPAASYTFDDTTAVRAALRQSAKAAYGCALAYRLTDNLVYSEKAVQILDRWATKDVNFIGNIAPGLTLGSDFTQAMYAVDLLRGYNSFENIRGRFEAWWRERVVVKLRAVITDRMPGNDDADWQDACDYWLDHAINGMLATAVAFDDSVLRDEMIGRLSDYFISEWRLFQAAYGPGGSTVSVPRNDIDAKSDGLIRGVDLTGHGLSALSQAFETARYCGTNLWNETTPGGANYKSMAEAWLGWNYFGDGFNHQLTDQENGWTVKRNDVTQGNILECFNSNLTMSTRFKDYLVSLRPVQDAERDDFTTLTRGDM